MPILKPVIISKLINSDTAVNSVQIDVIHVQKQVKLCIYPAEDNFGRVILRITQGKYSTIEPMPRLNKKRLESILESIKTQIETKEGNYYDVVKKLVDEMGYELQ